MALTRWVDSFFGDVEGDAETAESRLRVKVSTQWDERFPNQNRVTVGGKIDLPKLANRVDLVFRGDDPDELIRGDQMTPRRVRSAFKSIWMRAKAENIAPTSPWDCQALDQNRDLNIVITRCLTKTRHSGFPNVLSTTLTTGLTRRQARRRLCVIRYLSSEDTKPYLAGQGC